MRTRPRVPTQCWLLAVVLLIPACSGPPLDIEPNSLPNGVEGQTYRVDLTADGAGAIDWRVEDGDLPAGLHLSDATGTIAGLPTDPGTFTVTIGARDPSLPPRSGARTYTLTIIPQLVLDAALPPARVGVAYSATLVADGGVAPYRFDVIGLPAGLTFDADTGVVSGTALNPYSALPLEITVVDSGDPVQTVTEHAELVVEPRAVAITTTVLPAGRVSTAYSVQLSAVDGQPPYSWSVQAGLLPDGLRLNLTTGVISGTPTKAQTATVTIQVTDHDNPPSTDAREFTLTIEP